MPAVVADSCKPLVQGVLPVCGSPRSSSMQSCKARGVVIASTFYRRRKQGARVSHNHQGHPCWLKSQYLKYSPSPLTTVHNTLHICKKPFHLSTLTKLISYCAGLNLNCSYYYVRFIHVNTFRHL
jgi:hypothetical protein